MSDVVELTPEQEKLIPAFRREMWEVGTCTEPADWDAMEAAVREVYQEIGKPEPFIYRVQSPVAAEALITTLNYINGDRKKPLNEMMMISNGTTWWGQYEVYWLAFFIFSLRIGKNPVPEFERRLKIMERISRAGSMWYPYDEACILCDRPQSLIWDDTARGPSGYPVRLHNDRGPAILYRDGWSVYYWHGLRVPRRFIEKRDQITVEQIEAEANQEWRRALLEIFGYEKWIEARGAVIISEDECLGLPRKLYRTTISGDEIAHVVEVNNGSLEPDGSRRKFHIGVPDTCMTCEQAVAWTYGFPLETYQSIAKESIRT